ncbi:hypothetical protein GHT06_019819 [Daphnia sinensis]|uniref:Uncharacterized protein n=1 Tax=Daphnia sinensis TaxID=1820382 RepID=A0AAD5L213_9CRUS|nr:hypothetical protein GHT06_019819 [Daphnia sinensis]
MINYDYVIIFNYTSLVLELDSLPEQHHFSNSSFKKMNFYNPILSLIVFIALAYLAVADELTSNSLEHSETSSMTDASNGGASWAQEISSRNSGYFNNPRVYSHRPSPYQSYNKISSRDSTSYGGTPIHIANAGVNSYAPLTGSGYPSPSYPQSYPPASYPAALPSYPVPSYDHEDLVPHSYEDQHEEKNKFVKKHLALGISLPLILVPLAVIGVLAVLNFRAVFTVLVIRSLCSNDAFRTNFGQLCTFVDNINKRSSPDATGFKNLARKSHKFSRLMSLLNSARFIAMDHLNTLPKEN